MKKFEPKDYYGQDFKSIHEDGTIFSDLIIENCQFQSCSFVQTKWHRCKFEDCVFDRCDFSLAEFNKSSFVNVALTHSKMMSIDWTKLNIPFSLELKCEQCILDHSIFYGLNMKNSHIVESSAKHVIFEEADLSSATLIGSDFEQTRFHNTNLSGSNFSKASNYSIDYQYNSIKKAIFSLPEAASLLTALGIILK